MPRPLNVILDLTTRCNLKCIMCHFSATDRLFFPPFDRQLSEDGNLPLESFERIAKDFFPRAWRVALGCAAEPMIHPRFREILAIAGQYGVPDLWFPTNLLALSPQTAEALIDNHVTRVAASIDGLTQETYEKIRVPAKWDRLLACLDTLATVRRKRKSKSPRLRITFTWMESNRNDLAALPEFAQSHGASELDVRFVSPTPGVDVGPELLVDEDPAALNAELASTAHEAVRRGLKLFSYPDFEPPERGSRRPIDRARRRLWRWRAGMDRWEYLRFAWYRWAEGCAYPSRNYVIRPNGAVQPCTYWNGGAIGFIPTDGLEQIARGAALHRIREGLRTNEPVETCAGCQERSHATMYRLRLPSHPAGRAAAESIAPSGD